jgi:hypothetical protein
MTGLFFAFVSVPKGCFEREREFGSIIETGQGSYSDGRRDPIGFGSRSY